MARFLGVTLLLLFVHNAFGVADIPRSPGAEVNDIGSRFSARAGRCSDGSESDGSNSNSTTHPYT